MAAPVPRATPRTKIVRRAANLHYNGAIPLPRLVESVLKTGAYALPHFGTLHAVRIAMRRPGRLLSLTA
jgi:hypothetical protein